MKKILGLRPVLCLCGLSVFFTGCNQRDIKSYVDVPTYSETGAPAPETTEAAREKGGPKDVGDVLKAETDKLDQSRFEGLTGRTAFWFPENHSVETSDIKAFQILGLEEDYFYYYYVTRDTKNGREVHAVAKNHKSQNSHQLLYERQKEPRENEDASGVYAPFYVHMCAAQNGDYRISIYEDGALSVIDKGGRAIFSRASGTVSFGGTLQSGGESLLDLIDQIFGVGGEDPLYFDRDITSVSTGGRYNFYIPVTLTVQDYTKIEVDPAAQDSESVLETETYLLMYSYMPIGSGGNSEYVAQININYGNQVKYWQELAEDADGERDAEADWKRAKEQYPDKWDNCIVASGQDWRISSLGYLCKWKDTKGSKFQRKDKDAFLTGSGVLTNVDFSKAELVDKSPEGRRMEGYFFQDAQMGYCPIVGAVKEKSRAEVNRPAERSYTVVRGEGEDAEEETYEETVDGLYAVKYSFTEGSAIERFIVMNNQMGLYVTPGQVEGGAYTMGMCVANGCSLMRLNKDTEAFQTQRDIIFSGAGSNIGVHILNSLGGEPYVLGADLENKRVIINTPENSMITLMTSDINPSGYQQSETDKTLIEGLQERAKEHEGYDASTADMYGNPDRYTGSNVLVIGKENGLQVLLTSFYNGIQLFEGFPEGMINVEGSSKGTIYRLVDSPMYQAWMGEDGTITAVGFQKPAQDDGQADPSKPETIYQYMDIARARVYTFDIGELKEKAPSRQVTSQKENSGGGAGAGESAGAGQSGGSGQSGTKPGKGSQTLEIPKNMQPYWDDVKKDRESKPKPTGVETLPDVVIYDTKPNMGNAWQEAQDKKEKEESESP